MEKFSSNSVRESLKGSRKGRGYNGYYYDTTGSSSGNATPSRKYIKTVRLGDANKNQSQFEASKGSSGSKSTRDESSPFNLWRKVKNGYLNVMLNLAGNGATSFGDKRIPKARKPTASYAPSEFDNRVVLEIYKSMSTTS